AGYSDVTPLTGEEIMLMHDLISVRVVMSVLITEFRAAQFPERRDQITRNTPENWLRLEQLLQLSREQTTATMRRICNHEGKKNGPGFIQYRFRRHKGRSTRPRNEGSDIAARPLARPLLKAILRSSHSCCARRRRMALR